MCRHGIPEELLSDLGANFLSNVIQDVCQIKINTSLSDGLVEKFNSTLISMIAKSCDAKDRDWDDYLPYLLFAYRVSAQESTKESPFFLLYGRDARIPTSTVLSYTRSPYAVNVDDFKADMLSGLSQAWNLAASNITKSQASQKKHYDRNTREPNLLVGC